MRARAASAIAGSPVLLGAITVLVVVVSLFLAYNANQGLPFVPTYNVRVELPDAANLVETNDVRVSGFRVGRVSRIGTRSRNGRAIALVDLELDKVVEPLPADTRALVRPRVAFGLKYLELTPGTSSEKLSPGGTLPLANAEDPVETDDAIEAVFGAQTGTGVALANSQRRAESQTVLAGLGDAFAGRGQSINIALGELPELFEHLTPVMDTLNDPDTELDRLVGNLAAAAGEVAPVARTQAALFTEMADTFAALSASPPALQETISRQPPLYAEGIDKLPFQQAFVANATDLSNRLRPGAQELDRRLPVVNAAIVEGARTNRILPILNRELERVLAAVDHLAEDPNTRLALGDTALAMNLLEPIAEFAAPYQTVCNHAVYSLTGVGDALSETGEDGTAFRQLLKFGGNTQDDRLSDSKGDRPVDVSKGEDPHTARDAEGSALQALHALPYNPAIDARGNADCEGGQWGYVHGPRATGSPYRPARFEEDMASPRWRPEQPSGGSHVVLDSNTPGLSGPTFTGVPHLHDVDEDLRR